MLPRRHVNVSVVDVIGIAQSILLSAYCAKIRSFCVEFWVSGERWCATTTIRTRSHDAVSRNTFTRRCFKANTHTKSRSGEKSWPKSYKKMIVSTTSLARVTSLQKWNTRFEIDKSSTGDCLLAGGKGCFFGFHSRDLQFVSSRVIRCDLQEGFLILLFLFVLWELDLLLWQRDTGREDDWNDWIGFFGRHVSLLYVGVLCRCCFF